MGSWLWDKVNERETKPDRERTRGGRALNGSMWVGHRSASVAYSRLWTPFYIHIFAFSIVTVNNNNKRDKPI